MQPKINRLHERALPDESGEAQAIIREYLFGNPTQFINNDIRVIQSDASAVCHTYAVIDAMVKSDISVLLEAYDTQWECLWKGESQEHFAFYAPYVVKIESGTPFATWLIDQGWGKDWGIFIRSYLPLEKVVRHLRKFNQLYSEVDKRWVMFRYYSPDVVKTYIPFLPARDFAEFTQGLTQIIAENTQNNSVVFL
ncbi:DUF4123 domain-containing protein [Serratia fonticola]|uniref:DUF4123 domain-containing protein n=1 Tax=Serratia fonticola TaxID=47917 RepID=UPI0004285FB8|nr:DUF4123 domain-containing protein [Serratia fonticola]